MSAETPDGLDANGVNEHGVAMCACKPYGPVHAWEPGEWCGERVVPVQPDPQHVEVPVPEESVEGLAKQHWEESRDPTLDDKPWDRYPADSPVRTNVVAVARKKLEETLPFLAPYIAAKAVEEHCKAVEAEAAKMVDDTVDLWVSRLQHFEARLHAEVKSRMQRQGRRSSVTKADFEAAVEKAKAEVTAVDWDPPEVKPPSEFLARQWQSRAEKAEHDRNQAVQQERKRLRDKYDLCLGCDKWGERAPHKIGSQAGPYDKGQKPCQTCVAYVTEQRDDQEGDDPRALEEAQREAREESLGESRAERRADQEGDGDGLSV